MYGIPTFGWHFMVHVDKYTMNPVILSIKSQDYLKRSWKPPTFTPVAGSFQPPWCRDGWSHACANNPRPCFVRTVFPMLGGLDKNNHRNLFFFLPWFGVKLCEWRNQLWGIPTKMLEDEEITCWTNMTIWARSYSNSSTKIGKHETETTWQRNTLESETMMSFRAG